MTYTACVLASTLGFALAGADESTLLISTLQSFYNQGGGCLAIDPGKTLRADSQIVLPNNSSSPNFFQPYIRITGAGGSAFSTGSGSTLDLRYSGSGISAYGGGPKLLTLGQGTLELDHFLIADGGGSDCAAYVMTTGTTLEIHDVQFLGTSGNTSSPCNDAIILGGTNQPGATYTGTISDWMWGNGHIVHNRFGSMRRSIFAQSSVNGIVIDSNIFSGGNTGTNSTTDKSQVYFAGYGTGSNASRATVIENNLFEMSSSTCGVYLHGAEQLKLSGNGFWDGASGSYGFCGDSTATKNNFDADNFIDQSGIAYSNGLSSNNHFPPGLGTGAGLSGCSLSNAKGGNLAGSFTSGTSGTCTVTITPGITASNGFACSASDITNAALFTQTASSTTAATITATTTSGDTVPFSCSPF